MNAQDIIATVSAKTGLDPAKTEMAVGTILSVLEYEAGDSRIAGLFNSVPGAEDLAHSHDVMAQGANGGGLLGSISSALGGLLGEKASALVNGIAQLRASGLEPEQIKQAAETLLEQAKVAAGPDAIKDIVDAVPGLKSQLGLSQ
ncbi:hypothetical protein [Pseudaminobacter soli (ex Li et al. 2025)]|uniref:DUF2267 domain-containing protein n=1 Tax=Pseudaminobacter soli (ex Li et al. 2025) TaxID=1295366 RepID=A0A2P7SNY9_9HYPH|nr:hypothetical protein [Mesorhizobium soli]PSJ64209.1 hypothetical protein C7I85_00740 [Mesorhizobium soli]